jgi:PTS system nitrogen regulatory IIA component
MALSKRVAAWVVPEDIVLDVELGDGSQVLQCAAEAIARVNACDPAPIFRALTRREQSGSTALGCGVAVPHARIDGIERPTTVLLRPKSAVDFDAPDGKPVSSFYAILVPRDGDGNDHLRLLAAVAEMFLDRSFRFSVITARTAAELRSIFADRAAHIQ